MGVGERPNHGQAGIRGSQLQSLPPRDIGGGPRAGQPWDPDLVGGRPEELVGEARAERRANLEREGKGSDLEDGGPDLRS